MVAVQGIYRNGRLQLLEKAPMKDAKEIVIFQQDVPSNRQTREESLKLVEEFAGSNHEIIYAKRS